jgi:hypothetical protein
VKNLFYNQNNEQIEEHRTPTEICLADY